MSTRSIEFLLSRNRPADAERAIREALAGDPDDLYLRLLLCSALFAQDKPKAVEEAAREAISLGPDCDVAYFWLARALSERSRNKEALEAIDAAIRLDPDDADYFGVKASILVQLSRMEAALDAVETGLALDSDNEGCRFYRSILLGKAGRHEEADAEAGALLAGSPDDAENQCARGWVLHLRGDAEGAEQHFIEALRIDPRHEDARVGLVEALKMRQPIMGWIMRTLLWLDRFPWYYIVGGLVLANVAERFFSKLEHPVFPLIGIAIRVSVFFLILIPMVITPLFNLILAATKKGRYALSDGEKTALKWSVLPLIAGLAFLVMWAANGAKLLPVLAIACLSPAAMIAEIFETPLLKVRRSMAVVAVLAVLVGAWVIGFSYFWLRPELIGLIQAIGAESAAGSEDKVSPELMARLKELIGMRRHYVDYPVFALWFLAAFRSDVSEFFTRRTGDEA